mgnify:CR=1 FL=1
MDCKSVTLRQGLAEKFLIEPPKKGMAEIDFIKKWADRMTQGCQEPTTEKEYHYENNCCEPYQRLKNDYNKSYTSQSGCGC